MKEPGVPSPLAASGMSSTSSSKSPPRPADAGKRASLGIVAWSSDDGGDHRAAVAQQLAQAQAVILESHDRSVAAAVQRVDVELQRLWRENSVLQKELASAGGSHMASIGITPSLPMQTGCSLEKPLHSSSEKGCSDEEALEDHAKTKSIGIPGNIVDDAAPPSPCSNSLRVSTGMSDRVSHNMSESRSELVANLQTKKITDFGAMELLDVWSFDKETPGARSSAVERTVTRKETGRSSRKAVQNIHLAIGDDPHEMWSEDSSSRYHGKLADGHWRLVVAHPDSKRHITWDCLSLFLVTFDLIYLPFQLLEPEVTAFDDVVVWITRLFWTFDIASSFLSGYTDRAGFTEMRPSRIARRYIQTWLLLDLIVVGGSWVELIWEDGAEFARMGKASRSLRMLRLLRLLRMVRLWQTMAGFAERLQDEKLSIIAHVGKIVICIIGWSHLTACIWYGIGSATSENSQSWLAADSMQDRPIEYRYLTSLHWSLSQFAGGMDEVTPENSVERFYVIVVFILAFLLAASFTSVLTSSITRLHILTNGQSQLLSALRRFLGQNSISKSLAVRLQRNAQQSVTSRHIPEASVELLTLVSTPLRVEMHYELYMKILEKHPFFSRYNQECPHILQQICHYACVNHQFAWGDTVFSVGESPLNPKMYFVRSGTLEYVHVSACSDLVNPGMWVAEPVLWVTWMHRGVLKATNECVILELDANLFQGIASRFEHPTFSPWHYARKFQDILQEAEEAPMDLLLHVNNEELVKRADRGRIPSIVERSPSMDGTTHDMPGVPGFVAATNSASPSPSGSFQGPSSRFPDKLSAIVPSLATRTLGSFLS